jgi:hypothetical protein
MRLRRPSLTGLKLCDRKSKRMRAEPVTALQDAPFDKLRAHRQAQSTSLSTANV